MTFSELYATALDAQLGTDQTQLFTTAKRKQAIRDGERAFIRETGCTKRYGSISIVDGTGEYDVEATLTTFVKLAGHPSVRIAESGGTTRYIEGIENFPQTSKDQLSWQEPSWRATDAGTPVTWYLERDGGSLYFGLHPAPDVAVGDTWTLLLPYVGRPDTLTNDSDVPFSFSANAMTSLEDYHQALVHYAAAQLEPLRKNYDAVTYQMKLFASFVNRYKIEQGASQPPHIQLERNYFKRNVVLTDPRR